MADGSDSPEDLLKYYHKLLEGYDCVFGSRFIQGGSVVDYPRHKLLLNRMANAFIRVLFGLQLQRHHQRFQVLPAGSDRRACSR